MNLKSPLFFVSKKKCAKCKQILRAGEMAISAEFADPLARWHPRCFTCTECDELLGDLLYYNIADKVYCRKHYLNEHKPKVFCAACDMVETKHISIYFELLL